MRLIDAVGPEVVAVCDLVLPVLLAARRRCRTRRGLALYLLSVVLVMVCTPGA